MDLDEIDFNTLFNKFIILIDFTSRHEGCKRSYNKDWYSQIG